MSDLERAGEGGEIQLRSSMDFAELLVSMAEQSQISIKILSHQLDSKLYNNQRFIDSLSRFAVKSRYSKVTILLREPRAVLKDGHGVIALSQRFSSGIEIRRVSQDHRHFIEEYMIVDDRGVVFRGNHDRYVGVAHYSGYARTPELVADFKDQWEFATPETQFRRLYL